MHGVTMKISAFIRQELKYNNNETLELPFFFKNLDSQQQVVLVGSTGPMSVIFCRKLTYKPI
jgi:hypothetical protein